uniref:Uncharacterized protein n=1 Tax=Globodera rostochiensis TaxID=31243 RepID=A0A914I761_GLORO
MFEKTLKIIGPSNFHFSIILTILFCASVVYAELGGAVKRVLPPAPYKFVLFDSLVVEQKELRNLHLSRECSRQKLFANFGQNGWSTIDADHAAIDEQQQWHLKLSVLDDEKLLEKCLNGYYTVMTDHNGVFQMDVYRASRLNIHLIPLDKCGMPLKSEKVEGAAVQTLITFNHMLFSVGVLGTVIYHQSCSTMATILGDTDEASKFVLDSFGRLKTNGRGQLSTERVYFLAAYLRQIGAEITKFDSREGRPKLFCLQSMELLRVFPQQLDDVNLETIQNSQFFHGIFYELWNLCLLMTDKLSKYKLTRNENFEKIDLSRHIHFLFMGWKNVCEELGNLWPKKRPSVMLAEVLGRRMCWLDDLWKFGAVLKYLIWAMDGHGQTGENNGGQQKLDKEDKQMAIKIGNFLTESHRRQMAKTALKTAQIQKHVEQFCLSKYNIDEEIVRAWEKVCDWVSVELFKRWLNNEEELSLDSESKLKSEFKRLVVNENGNIAEKNIKLLEEIGAELSISTKNQMKNLLWNKVPKIEGLKQLFQEFCVLAKFAFDQKFKSWRTFCVLIDFRDQLLISHDSYGTKGPSKYSKNLENLIEEAENEGKKRMSPEDKELLDLFGALMAKMLGEHEEGREVVARNLIRLIRVNGFCWKKWPQFHAWDKLCFQLLKESVMEWMNAQNDLQRGDEPQTDSTSTTIKKEQIPLDQSTRLMMDHLRSLHQRVNEHNWHSV